jgi:uncharacterized protein
MRSHLDVRRRVARVKKRSMRFVAALAAAVVLACGLAGGRALAQTAELPTLTQPVNDLANVIDPSSAAAMDQMIRSLQAATGDAVIVAAVKTFAPFGSIEEYAVKLYERAGIGVKGKDNGVLILVAVDDRRARIEIGYGLEGFLTDGVSGDVIRSAMLPAFRRGAYGEGLLDATTQIVGRIARERNVTLSDLPAPRPAPRAAPKENASIGSIILFVVIVLFLISRSSGGRGGRRGGGGTSGLLGFILGQMLAGGGRGGGWNGGGFGGGGFGGGLGGGFGGFGGGRSGGGGASGGW